ncbi:histidine protein methyltransferase 1 homolog [Lampris incognitus]|uniref:histidine protein methyltransferase 1 homolog n=1 Tax=Lampris incognitus TaxID=2546036 RepID=UPI0024B52D98|nr:histidine protein methyltransferase 1 homolog [Lampris incognitus]
MSFSFNFDVRAQTVGSNDGGEDDPQTGKADHANATAESAKQSELVKDAKEHFPPLDLRCLFVNAVPETVTIGSLPPLHFLNETVFEKTSSDREDGEKILACTAEQRSDLISGVYEGGLKVWECTYDLLELVERDGETFGGKRVLDLGCGAGLLGILALKRGATQTHFQDYNSTVIEHLTLPNVLLNCQGDDLESEDDEEEDKGKAKRKKGGECKNKVRDEERQEVMNDGPTAKKRAPDQTQHSSLNKCRFFSGDWTTFLALVMKEDRPPKYDIIFTSETIYNTDYYPALHDTLHRLLAPDGLVYLATKSHYFGVGGGLYLFERFVEQRGVFSMQHLWDLDEGLQRHVMGLRFGNAKAP